MIGWNIDRYQTISRIKIYWHSWACISSVDPSCGSYSWQDLSRRGGACYPVVITRTDVTVPYHGVHASLRWRHNGHKCVSNHQPRHCLLNRLFERRSKKTSKLRVTGLCAGNSPGTGEFPAQMASNAENVSIWWRRYDERRCMSPKLHAIFKWSAVVWQSDGVPA